MQSTDALSDQSLHGILLRSGLSGPLEYAVLLVLAIPVLFFGVRRAVGCFRDDQRLLAAGITACTAFALIPVSWTPLRLVLLLTVTGRLGRQQTERLVWPIAAVLVALFGGSALVPGKLGFLGVASDNLALILAVTAACGLPFLKRGSPHWTATSPSVDTTVRRGQRRLLGLPVPALPARMRPLSRPNLLLELLMIRAGYSLYSYVRGSVPDQRSVAESHGHQIMDVQRFLHIDMEHTINHFVASVGWLEKSMNVYYSTFHFIVPLALLGLLYVRRPELYRSARTALCAATALAVLGFWLYPLAPPRLLPGYDFIDTANGPQDLANPKFALGGKLANQYAAMPSLHVGWSLWSALVIAALAPWIWLRVVGMLYPLATTMVIMGTANHYILDAVGGVLVVSIGFTLQYVLTGRPMFGFGRKALAVVPPPRQESVDIPGITDIQPKAPENSIS